MIGKQIKFLCPAQPVARSPSVMMNCILKLSTSSQQVFSYNPCDMAFTLLVVRKNPVVELDSLSCRTLEMPANKWTLNTIQQKRRCPSISGGAGTQPATKLAQT